MAQGLDTGFCWRRKSWNLQRGETYTPRRVAQFLLEKPVDATDYAAARPEVRKLGLNPHEILGTPPPRSSDRVFLEATVPACSRFRTSPRANSHAA